MLKWAKIQRALEGFKPHSHDKMIWNIPVNNDRYLK